MKYFTILMLLVGLVGFSIIIDDVYGLMIPLSPEKLYEQSQTIFVGNITSVDFLEFEKSSVTYIEKEGIEKQVIENYTLILDEYTVAVEEFVKNPQDSAVMTLRQPTTSVPGRVIPIGGFEQGDRILFFLQNLDDVNEYSFESFMIPPKCDAKTVLKQPRIELKNSFEIVQDGITKDDNYVEGIPMKFILSKDMDTLDDGSIDVDVSIRKEGNNQVLFEKNIHSELESCHWITSATWEFTPEVGNYKMHLNIKENGESRDESYTGFTVFPQSPLKQFSKGIFLDEIKCKENLVLIQKYDGSPACVKPQTKQKLIERGWTQNISKNTLDKKWEFHTNGEVSSIDISRDGEIVVVGTKIEDSQRGLLYLLDVNGLQLWQHEFDSMISNVAISKDSSRILTQGSHLCGAGGGARYYCEPSAYLYDITGNKLWSYAPENGENFYSPSLSSNGKQMTSNTYDEILFFDMDKETSWKYNTNRVQESMFLDDYTIVANTDESIIALNNKGDNLWNFTREYQNSYAMATSQDGQYVISADDSVSDDSYLYLLDKNGDLLWKKHVGVSILELSFSGDSLRILVQTNKQFMAYDLQGTLLWKNNIPSDVTFSSNGSFLVGSTFNQGRGASITIFDGKGNIVSNYPTASSSISRTFSLANNDRYFAIAESVNQVSFYELSRKILENDILFDLSDFQNSEELHIAIIPQGNDQFDVTIEQGDSLEIPWDIKLDDGYTTGNFRVSIEPPTTELESWITPTSPYVTINGIPPSKRVITLHPHSNLEAEDYAVHILGQGNSMHNETGWLTELDGQILGTINVNVIPKQNSLSIKTGKIQSESETFCVDMSDGNGRFCGGGPKYQTIPITVFSNTTQQVKLKSSVVQDGGWIKFVPQEFMTGPNGTTVDMIMAGYLVPARSNPLSDKSLVIEASSETENTTTTLPVSFGTISVINDEPTPINLGKIRTNSNGTNFSVSGVVYDPIYLNPEESLPVNLSIGGLWKDGKAVDLPSWLQIEIPEPSFVLNAITPYNFMIMARTTNAPESGTYFVAINQNINGTDFVELEELDIENIRH